MAAYLVAEFEDGVEMKKARAPSAPAPPLDDCPSVHVFPELLVKEIREHEQCEQHQQHDVADLLARDLIGLGHPGHEIDQIAHENVVIDLGERARRIGPDRLEDIAL